MHVTPQQKHRLAADLPKNPKIRVVEEDGQTSDGQDVTEQEAAVTRPGIAIVVMMSQTHSLEENDVLLISEGVIPDLG